MSDQTITSLIEKLEGAEVGSRELDLDVAQALNMKLWGRRHPSNNSHQWMTEIGGRSVPVPRYTTSLDAALALAERVLPGWRMHALQDQQGIYQTDNTATRWAAGISEMRGPGNVLSYAPTPSLAVCASIMKARAQSEARPTGEDSPANEGEGAQ